MRSFEETKCNNSLATDYVITSGYKVLFGESRQLSLPLTKVPNIERPGYLVVLNEGAERYAELHREVLDGYDYEYDDRYVYWLSGRYALEALLKQSSEESFLDNKTFEPAKDGMLYRPCPAKIVFNGSSQDIRAKASRSRDNHLPRYADKAIQEFINQFKYDI